MNTLGLLGLSYSDKNKSCSSMVLGNKIRKVILVFSTIILLINMIVSVSKYIENLLSMWKQLKCQ